MKGITISVTLRSAERSWYNADGIDMITKLTTPSVALALQELSNTVLAMGLRQIDPPA